MNNYIDNITLEYINKYNKLNGIKPNSEDIINLNDTIDIAIIKFNKWFDKALDFAQGDARDLCGFIRLNNNFLDLIINIENNNFLNYMKFIILHNKESQYGLQNDYNKLINDYKLENDYIEILMP